MHQLLTALMYRSLGILVLVLVLVDWTASLANNDVFIKDAANGTTTLATLMDSLCHGQPLHCACFPSLDPGTMDDWESRIICDHLGITEIPRWSSDHHSDDSVVESNGSTVVSVSFQQNRLTKILEFNASDVINALSFDGNDIDEISPCAFQGLPNLRTLSIRDNRLDKIDHRDFHTTLASGGLALEELDLSDNYLVHVDDDAFEQLPRLKVLRLSNNPIHALDLSTVQALNSLHGLRHLQLSHAQLTELPSTQLLINPMRNLLELDLSYNRLLEVPDALQNAVRLVELNLDGNPMYELDVLSFVGLVNLEQLDVNNMINLDNIYRGTFTSLSKLTTLRCSNNSHLSGIETEAFFNRYGHGTTSLKTIIMQNNNLSAVNQETFALMPNVTMALEGNPLHCSCYIAWLNVSHGNLSCKTPESLSGRLLKDVDFEKAPCDGRDEPHRIIFVGLAVSLGALLVVLIVGAMFVVARRAKMPFPHAHYRRAHNNEACDLYNE